MSDFCYSFPVFSRVLDRAALMDRVMERIGTDPGRAARVDEGMAWYEARTRCIACNADRQCHAWLELPVGGAPQTAPVFCPNAAFLESCRAAKDSEG
jgi:hypothetical protein